MLREVESDPTIHQHLHLDQRKNLITCTGSPLAHAYHVWSTSVNGFVSYPANRQTDKQTNNTYRTTPPWWS